MGKSDKIYKDHLELDNIGLLTHDELEAKIEFLENNTVGDHNDLSNLQGGSSTERFHLTQAEQSLVTNFATTVLNTVLTGISFISGTAVVATDSILVGIGKLQKQISDLFLEVSGKENTGVAATLISDHEGEPDPHSQYATDTALSNHTGDTNNPHSVTKTQVGLSNVDNTSDLNKPISTATQTALDGKENTGVAASLVSAHESALNPHSQYTNEAYTGTAERTVGGITNGQVFTNATMATMWDTLIKQEYFPTLTAPSSTFTASITGLREVGEVISVTFNSAFNRGSINPQYTAASPFRSGLPNTYQFVGSGLSNQAKQDLTDAQTVSGYTVLINAQNWQGRVAYDAGVQPKSSYDNDFSTPLAAGNTSYITRTITGVYPFFATTVNLVTMTKQALLAHAATATISMVAEDGVDKQKFEVAVSYGTLSAIQQYNTLSGLWDTISTATFTMTTVSRDINGTMTNYRLYTHNGATIGARQVRFIF
jgi:hypothetical protein